MSKQSRRKEIEELRQQLQHLTIVTRQIRKKISDLEEQEGTTTPDINNTNSKARSQRTRATATPKDRFGTPINIGDRVTFLTEGKYRSTEGVVTRFSKNKERVFALDPDRIVISRVTHNVNVQK